MTADLPVVPSPPHPTLAPEAATMLLERYLKALALLCECQPYVDEPEYEAQLDALLREACEAYGLEMRRIGGRFEIALGRAACAF